MTAPTGPVLVLGTTSSGKLRELRRIIEPLRIVCRALADVPGAVDVDETGTTFAANAGLKAAAQARACRAWVLAEDSGLCVAALGGAPGIRSARFAGEPRDDAANNRLLLERLADATDRTAHYACYAALASPDGAIVATSHGECHGVITAAPGGTGGFGYDPLFVVPEYHRTFGTLPGTVKDLISHRARAIRAISGDLLRHLRPAASCLPPTGR